MNQTPSYLKNLKKESVVQSVINCLTDAMRNKELKPGDQIPPEPELAASLGVARGSVREAIKILAYLGVLESKRSEGTFVCSGFQESMIDPMVYGIILNQDSFENLMELREMTEAGSMRLAMEKRSEAEMAELETLLEELKLSLEKPDPVDSFFHADNTFHEKISQMGKNPLADKISRVVRTLTYSMRYDTVKAMISGGRTGDLLAAHEKLYLALKKRDSSQIDRLVRDTYFDEVLEAGVSGTGR